MARRVSSRYLEDCNGLVALGFLTLELPEYS